ncbi:MAG: mannose-6-phosphate isomerase, class I [Candidatus Cloacimonetes bacterium]|nr:mannose-6-phosphate isomerase, class I [Candidatus Cloacimonadota bacterium]
MNADITPEIYKLINPIRNYGWGSKSFISTFLGKGSPSVEPEAEMWLGAHPLASSKVISRGKELLLVDLIKENPKQMLSENLANRFKNRLPFLFKMLAAEMPLSIQAHPDKKQAEAGFKKEDSINIPRGSDNRNYKDENHKPELIYALTEFELMCGFQPPSEIIKRMEYLRIFQMIPGLNQLSKDSSANNIRAIFRSLMSVKAKQAEEYVKALTEKISLAKARNDEDRLIFKWIAKLAALHPQDIGVFSPLILNVLRLLPGQALFIKAGILHSYLHGSGLEVMANSDNVLRGGLTHKKIDLVELDKILKFEPINIQKLQQFDHNKEIIYRTSAEEFQLSRIMLNEEESYENSQIKSPEILLCTEGFGKINSQGTRLEFKKGDSIFIPFAVKAYRLTGTMGLFRVVVPSK